MPPVPVTISGLVPWPRQYDTRSNDLGQDGSGSRRGGRIRKAVEGLQRFRQSWISIVILKGTIGLGQVVVVVTLLVVASKLDSPLYPLQKQTTPSDACPHPKYMQAWMDVQIARLTLCWCTSLWVCLRARRASSAADQGDASDVESHPHTAANPSSIPARAALQAVPTLPVTTRASSSASTSTVDDVANPQTPPLSSSATSATAPKKSIKTCPTSPHPSEQNRVPTTEDDTQVELPVPHVLYVQQPRHIEPTPSPAEMIRAIAELNSSTESRRADVASSDDVSSRSAQAIAASMDRIAPFLQKLLGLVSIILFILGNLLVFHPLPRAAEGSCYTASPMLWWGVMTITGVGWFLLAQILVIVLVIGYVGQMIALGFIPEEPDDSLPSTQDLPLTANQLKCLPIVYYVPSSTAQPASHVLDATLQRWTVHLDSDHAVCAICHEDYVAYVAGGENEADRLRKLPCKHVYHTKCVDEWLLSRAGNCPTCKSVIVSESTVAKV